MAYDLMLPANKQQRETALVSLIDNGIRFRHLREVGWKLSHHYLQGVRDFTNVNFEAGTLDVNYINEDGVLRFRYDEIVAKFQAQIGRMLQVDLRPLLQRKSIGLEDMRKASIAQVVLDQIYPTEEVERLKLEILPSLTKYGCIGLIVWNRGEDIGIDIILPWELVPIPAHPIEDKDVRGLARVRYVPLSWVERLESTPGPGAKIYDEMEKTTVPIGSIPSESGSRFSTFAGHMGAGGATASTKPIGSRKLFGTKKDKTQIEIVRLDEIFIEDATHHLRTYDMVVGKKLLVTKDYTQNHITMPITKCNDIPTGDFWGRSFVSLQLPMNTEMEYALGRQFQNVQDLDTYGILCIPATLGIPPQVERGSDGTKRLLYNPDYTLPDLKPFNIEPVNSGNFPGEVLKMGSALADKMANQPASLMRGEAPGRVDSKLGLGFLFETSNTNLMPSAADLANSMTQCYKASLDMVAAGAWPPQKLIQVTMLDDSLAGVVVDSRNGTISLETNTVPRPNEVTIFVKSMAPQSKEQRKMELMKSLEVGSIDMFEYRVTVRKEGLDLPVGNEAEWQNYRKAMMENIILFGDGNNTGQVVFDVDNIHEVHMRIHQAFMARPEFFKSSPQVQDAFKQHYEAHQAGLGIGMPDQAPYAEDAAMEQDLMQQQMGQLGAGPPTQ